MRKITLVLLLLVICTSAFAKQKKHKKKPAPLSDIEQVSLRHTACYGRCPIYTISVNKNGIATYTATLFNPDTGVFTKNIGEAKAMDIINRFVVYQIDTCKDLYTSRMADIPGTVFVIKHKTTTKLITDASAGPPVLDKLRVMMDSLVTRKVDNSWRKISSDPNTSR